MICLSDQALFLYKSEAFMNIASNTPNEQHEKAAKTQAIEEMFSKLDTLGDTSVDRSKQRADLNILPSEKLEKLEKEVKQVKTLNEAKKMIRDTVQNFRQAQRDAEDKKFNDETPPARCEMHPL